jgi:nucleoside phosphorylase
MSLRTLNPSDYTVGWVSALPVELAAAAELLDEEHEQLPQDPDDNNLYTLGSIGEHNVVIACLPAGQTGTNSAAAVAMQMKRMFPSLRFGLMVGIGGGFPSAKADVRLGDVVVSQPLAEHGGVVQYDFGKSTPSGFVRTGFLSPPPRLLLNALAKSHSLSLRGKNNFQSHLSKIDHIPAFRRDYAGPDILFESSYDHGDGPTCETCDKERLVKRTPENREMIMVHYGTIASGNQVMRDGATRDKVSSELGGVLCFEMEAAGLMNNFPCLVVRGM